MRVENLGCDSGCDSMASNKGHEMSQLANLGIAQKVAKLLDETKDF